MCSINATEARLERKERVVSLNTRCAYETLHFKCVPTRCVTTMVPTIKKPGYVYQLYICICDHRNEHVRRDIAGKTGFCLNYT